MNETIQSLVTYTILMLGIAGIIMKSAPIVLLAFILLIIQALVENIPKSKA